MKTPKLIAFYFPQFHAIPENDAWWGKGFQDWLLVQRSKPLFKGHNQPRVPYDHVYYNPCDYRVLEKQAAMAKQYGVYGFMFYHYYFDGKLLLEKPLETFLRHKSIDMPFCISWANETWARGWAGKPHVILQEQKHVRDKNLWKQHFLYLLPFLQDERYIRIDDKPVFIIYQPTIIPHSDEFLAYWNELALENGLKGLYLVANKNHQYTSDKFLTGYNGVLKFQPREAFNSKDFQSENIYARFQFLRNIPEKWQGYLRRLLYSFSSYTLIDSKKIWDIILAHAYERNDYGLDVYESAFFEWDNTPRYGKHAKIYTGMTKEMMKDNLQKLYDLAVRNQSEFIFFNAWNEWSESAYLEPDTRNGFDYLNIIKSVFDR